jgi:hypothetical protein
MPFEPLDSHSAEARSPLPGAPKSGPAAAEPAGHSHRLNEAAVTTAARLLPLVRLLETLQPLVASDSVFHTKRVKIQEEMTRAYGELLAEKPRHKALLHAFKTLGELVREEAHDLSKDELKQAAREVVLATLKNAPQLISAAHQAQLLS